MSSPKADAALDWIQQGLVRIYVDVTRPGVKVPKHLRKKTSVAFDWGFDLPRPITDLKIDPTGIRGTLSFGGYGLCFCDFPWTAVFCIQSPSLNRSCMWPNDAPPDVQRDLLLRVGEEANKRVREMKAKPATPRRGHLRLVKGGK